MTLSVVRGGPRDYVGEHPSQAVPVVEVSESTLGFDRRRKAPLYAAAGVPDFWIVNLVDRRLEVFRDPVGRGAPRRTRPYGTVQMLGARDVVAPVHAPSARIRVADLLP